MGGVAGKGAGEQSLARKPYRRLEEDWLLIADRNFFNWADWCQPRRRCSRRLIAKGGSMRPGTRRVCADSPADVPGSHLMRGFRDWMQVLLFSPWPVSPYRGCSMETAHRGCRSDIRRSVGN